MTRRLGHVLSRSRAGYSLLEVIVVIAMLGVAATLSGPSISRMIAGQEAQQVVRGLVTEFGAIRADAFLSSTIYDAAAIQARLSEHAPPQWRVEVGEAITLSQSGYCSPGLVHISSPEGRIWTFSIAEGDCMAKSVS